MLWLFSLPLVIIYRNKLFKVGMEGIKPPYILLCNHNAFMDFMVAEKATFPHRVNSPFWSLPSRHVKPTSATMTCIATKEDVEEESADELNEVIRKAFEYDDWAWLKNSGIKIR